MDKLAPNSVIASVTSYEDLEYAIMSEIEFVFSLSTNILTLFDTIKKVHSKNKKIYIHTDFTEGIGKDKYALMFMKKLGVDGIVSTRSSIIKMARELNLSTVQRFFIVDSHSVHTTIEAIKTTKPDMVEIMPGIMPKVITAIKKEIDKPLIAGGLITSRKEIDDAFKAGADGVSMSNKNFWNKFN